MRIVCPDCKRAGLRSRVYDSGVVFRTDMGFSQGYFDEDGEWVPGEDPNYSQVDYRCSNGHTFSISRQYGDAWYGHYLLPKEKRVPVEEPKGGPMG